MYRSNAVKIIALGFLALACGKKDFQKSDLEGSWKTDCTNASSFQNGQTTVNGSRKESYVFDQQTVVHTLELYTGGSNCATLAGKIEVRGTYDLLVNSDGSNSSQANQNGNIQKTLQVYVSSVTATAVSGKASELQSTFADCQIGWQEGTAVDASFKFCNGQQLPGVQSGYGYSTTNVMHELATMSNKDLLTLQSVYQNIYNNPNGQNGTNPPTNTTPTYTPSNQIRMFFKDKN